MKSVRKLKNMSSERTKVFSLLFAFAGKPRKTLGYKTKIRYGNKKFRKRRNGMIKKTEREKQDAGIEKCVF